MQQSLNWSDKIVKTKNFGLQYPVLFVQLVMCKQHGLSYQGENYIEII